MKGIILAGGLGIRLMPLTKITNKHLLPVYNKPMVYYPIEKLVEAGVTDILIITGGNHSGEFVRLLGSGKQFGCKLHYEYQESEGGIAQALSLAEYFTGKEQMAVILGDNIFKSSIKKEVLLFKKQKRGAKILLSSSTIPERFGVVEFEGNRIKRIVEKPKNPKSSYVVTGIYLYDRKVFDIIKDLKPSKRNELEITDVNNKYLEWKELKYSILDSWWTDAGTFDSLLRANRLVKEEIG